MFSKHIFIFTILSYLFISVQPANILFYFIAANFSQKNSIWPLVVSLAQNGHNVTFLSPQTKASSTHPNISDLAPKPLQDLVAPLYKIDRFAEREADGDKNFDYAGTSVALCKTVVDGRLTDPTFQKLFSSDTHFDLVIVNALLSECGFHLAKYFKAKSIQYSPATFAPFFYETYGVTTEEVAWVPDYVYKINRVPMTFLDRAYNALMPVYWQWVKDNYMSPGLEKIWGPLLETDKPQTLYEVERQASLVFVNSHVSADFAKTLPPYFIDVGGMTGWDSPKEIPQKFLTFMESAKDGVVLITFGSTVLLNTVSTRHQQMFFKMIFALPHVKFVMRWKGPLPEFAREAPKNLMVSEWLPQRELLRHPSMRAFITHGGISSIHEATYNGVPVIALPLFSDQDYNAYRVEAQQVGVRVEIRGMTGDTLIEAVRKVLQNPSYKKNMLQKSKIFKDRPKSPVETALFWTEFVLRHNDTISTLRPENRHLNLFQRRMLDVYLFEFICLLISMLIIYKLALALLFKNKLDR